MTSPEDPKSKHKTQESIGSSPSEAGAIHERGSLAQPEHTVISSINSDADSWTDADKADFKWKFEKHSENFRFFIEQGLKAVGLFYAIVGGILSIYFAKEPDKNDEVLKVLLWAPFVISLVLGFTFIVGGILWRNATNEIIPPADRPRTTNVLNFGLLTWLAWIFGLLFFAIGGALVWLIYRLT